MSAETCSARPGRPPALDLHLLAARVVALGLAPSYSYESVRRVLKNGPQAVAEEAMVHPRGECGVRRPHGRRPEVYAEPYDPTRPKVNFAETTKPLMKEPRLPPLALPGGRSALIGA